MKWPRVPLGEISASVEYGLTASANSQPVGPKFLRITDIQDDCVRWDTVPYCDATPQEEVANCLAPGDIVFARTGATTGKSFLIRECPERTVFASYLIRVRPSERLDSIFLSSFFRSAQYWDQIRSRARGAAQPGINSTILKELSIPLPPLAEQRRIAAILDQADDLRRKRREALAHLQQLRTVLFEVKFLGTACAKYPWGTIDDLTDSTQYGTSSKAGEDGEFPILRMGNITYEGNIDASEIKYIDLTEFEFDKYTVRDGDILFNRTNSPELVGKTAVVRGQNNYAFAGYLVRLRVNDRAVPEFVSGYLNSKRGKATLRGMCKAIIGMANINAQELRGIRIPLPPLELQRTYTSGIEEIGKLEACHRAHLAKLDALFASLQHRAFCGEL